MRIPEDYIHYLWRYKAYQMNALLTNEGEEVEVLDPGFHNQDAGPDFSSGRLRIGDKEWAGNIEIHFKSSDWDAHGHQHDTAYDSVILHVVIHHDREVKNSQGAALPTLSLSSYLSIDHFRGYEQFIGAKKWVPCESHIAEVDPVKLISIKERMAFDRIQKKAERIRLEYEKDKNWEEIAFRLLARAFGGKVNSEPFEHLARVCPVMVMRKHSDSIPMLEAFFLGQAGFLSDDFSPETDYEHALKRDYQFIQHKYNLKPMPVVSWKNARLRPSSAPQVRIVQFANLWLGSGSLHSAILNDSVEQLKSRFRIKLEGYWSMHIGLQHASKTRPRSVGDSLLDRLIINVIAPIRFAYGLINKEQSYKDSALYLLQELAPEDNSVIRKWKSLGISSENALDSQGLLELKLSKCDLKQCLTCSVGHSILK